MRPPRLFLFFLGLFALLSACGSTPSHPSPDGSVSPDAPPDVSTRTLDASFVTDAVALADTAADAPAAPVAILPSPRPIVTNNSGPVYTHPSFIVVDYTGDPNAQMIEDVVHTYATSSLFVSQLEEYGITAGTYAGSYHLSVPPPCNAPCILPDGFPDPAAQVITDAIGAGTVPAPGDQTIYVLKLPAGVTAGGGCDTGYAYHGYEPSQGFPYDVIFECTDTNITESQLLSEDVSHEMAESTTDPVASSNPGYSIPWDPQGGEVCDYCGDTYTQLFSFWIQRVYSNAAAMAGADPCVPYGTGPYASGYIGAGPSVSSVTVTANGPGVPLVVTVFATPGISDQVIISATGSNGINVSPSSNVARMPGDAFTFTVSADNTAGSGPDHSVWISAYPASAPYDNEVWPVQVVVQ